MDKNNNNIKLEQKNTDIKTYLLNMGFDICAHLFAGIGIGLAIDKYFATKPVFLMVCLLISVASVIVMIVKN
jgi:F0F1-type ATP synthase assembly protein I